MHNIYDTTAPTPKIKAVETYFGSIRYRSRLEAKWAALFDSLGIQFDYEPEKYDVGDGKRYIPDFFLRNVGEHGTFFEVKGPYPTDEEIDKCGSISEQTGIESVIFYGSTFRRGITSEMDEVELSQCPFCGNFGFGVRSYFGDEMNPVEERSKPRLYDHLCLEHEVFSRDFGIDSYFTDDIPWEFSSPAIDMAVELASTYRFESPEFKHEAAGRKRSIALLKQQGIFAYPKFLSSLISRAKELSLNEHFPRWGEWGGGEPVRMLIERERGAR